MSEAPERIWAWRYSDPWGNELRWFEWKDFAPEADQTEYIRADVRADREAKLVEALHDAINSPKGVVPKSAEPFYDPKRYRELSHE